MEEDISEKMEGFQISAAGKIRIELPEAVTVKSLDECRRSLVIKVISDSRVSYGALFETLKSIWKCRGKFELITLGDRFYQAQFDLEIDADKILLGCPWYYKNQLLIIKKWKPKMEIDDDSFKTTPIWVQVWNLCLDWTSPQAGEHICRVMGKVLKKEVVCGGPKYGKFARCLVELDISKPLVQGMEVTQGGDKRWISLKYENVSLYCAYCGIIGHKATTCDIKVMDQKNGIHKDELFGAELYAPPFKAPPESSSPFSDTRRLSPSVLQENRRTWEQSNLDRVKGLASELSGEASNPERVMEKTISNVRIPLGKISQATMNIQNMTAEVGGSSSMLISESRPAPETTLTANQPEILMLEWYPLANQNEENVPQLLNSPLDAMVGQNTSPLDVPLENLFNVEILQSDTSSERKRKRKFKAKKTHVASYSQDSEADANEHMERRNDNKQDVEQGSDYVDLSEPFLKKLKIKSLPSSDAEQSGVEAASPKWLPPSP